MATNKVEIEIAAKATGFSEQFAKISASAKSAAGQIRTAFSGAQGALAALGVGASVAGFTTLIKGAIDAADKLNDLSKVTGVGATTLGGIGFAAQQAGTDLEGVAKSFGKMNLLIADARAGNAQAVETFRKLGVSVSQLRNESSGEIFGRLAESFSSFEDGADKAAAANAVFGKSYASVLPLLDEGGESLRKNIDYFARYSGVNDDLVRASDQFNDSLTKLSLLQKNFTNQLVAHLLPGLQELVNQLVDGKEKGGGFAETADRIVRGLAVIAKGALAAASAVGEFGEFLGSVAAQGVMLAKLDYAAAKAIGEDYDARADRSKKRLAEIAKIIDRVSTGSDGTPESLKDTRGGPPPVRPKIKAPSFGDPGRSASAKKEVDEFAKALERVNKLAAESEEALAAAFSGKELTGAQKALASLTASDEWAKFTQPQRDQLTAAYQMVDAKQREAEQWKKTREETEKQIEALQRLQEEQQKYADSVTQDIGKFADDTADFERLIALTGQDQLAHDKLTVTLEKERMIRRAMAQENSTKALEDIAIIEEQAARRIKALEAMTAAQEKFNDVQQYNQIFADAFADNVAAIADGTKSIKDAFRDMERSIAQAITRIATQKLADTLFGVGPGQSGGIGSFLSSLFSLFGGTAGGGAPFAAGSGMFLAEGGPVAANQPYVVGDGGEPELFVPKTAGTVIPGHKLGGGISVTNIFHITGPVDSRTQRQIASSVSAGVAASGQRG